MLCKCPQILCLLNSLFQCLSSRLIIMEQASLLTICVECQDIIFFFWIVCTYCKKSDSSQNVVIIFSKHLLEESSFHVIHTIRLLYEANTLLLSSSESDISSNDLLDLSEDAVL